MIPTYTEHRSTQPTPAQLAASTPVFALAPRELVTDAMLRDLARGDAQRDLGEITTEDQRLLAMVLPDLCGELLARRAAMEVGAT